MHRKNMLRERGGQARIQVEEGAQGGLTVRQGELIVRIEWTEIEEICGRKFGASGFRVGNRVSDEGTAPPSWRA